MIIGINNIFIVIIFSAPDRCYLRLPVITERLHGGIAAFINSYLLIEQKYLF